MADEEETGSDIALQTMLRGAEIVEIPICQLLLLPNDVSFIEHFYSCRPHSFNSPAMQSNVYFRQRPLQKGI